MVFNLARLNQDTKIVSNTDDVFAGTSLEDGSFSIVVKNLKRTDRIEAISSAVKDDGTISNAQYSKALFMASISDVSGFTDENGQPLSIEDGVAEIIWEYAPDMLVEEVKKAIQAFTAVEEKKSDLPESDLNNTPYGQ